MERQDSMEPTAAKSLLEQERVRLQRQLADVSGFEAEDREAEAEIGDEADAAQSLAAEGVDDAVAESLHRRLAAVERALQRIDEGTYGRSILSGVEIPAARLEADPAAELTIDEAAQNLGHS
jgi:DnaK suppressor protein